MSAFGPKQTSLVALHMSAFGGKADMKSQFMLAFYRALKSAIGCSLLECYVLSDLRNVSAVGQF